MNNSNNFRILIILNIILLVSGVLLLANSKNSKIVYIENIKVFEKFAMTQELKKKGDTQLKAQQIKVDSLYRLLNNPSYIKVKENLMQAFVAEKEALDNFTVQFADEQSVKVWNRIYEYSDDFAKQYNYQFILGMQPNENIMYGSENTNVTEDFVKFINSKYEGN